MIVRSLLLLLPLCIWAWIIIIPRWSSRKITAMFFGFVWAFHSTLILNILFLNTKVLSFYVYDNLFYGVPLDWIIAQSIIIGAIVPLSRLWNWSLFQRTLLQSSLLALIYSIEIVNLSGFISILVTFFVIVLSAIPAMFLSDWTALDTSIRKRAFLQSLAWAIFLFWFFPSLIFNLTSDSWSSFLQRDIVTFCLYLLPLVLPAYLLVNALYYFAVKGNGTAFPYDPPKQIVTEGVYRYISNPMQVGISLAMLWWGVVLQSLWISISAIVAVILFIVFKDVCNGSCAIGFNNSEWDKYQNSVPKWWPRINSK